MRTLLIALLRTIPVFANSGRNTDTSRAMENSGSFPLGETTSQQI